MPDGEDSADRAVMVADIEDALALTEYRALSACDKAAGVPHDEVRARLGLERA
ncbi:prevent-host-death family protein [Streptomyces sp. 8N616]|uniref:prevent-host-death family protein n=1 Tax=Streptomyces sp. 8N616 TaxID=3457414 RepID=UPI003FCF9B89